MVEVRQSFLTGMVHRPLLLHRSRPRQRLFSNAVLWLSRRTGYRLHPRLLPFHEIAKAPQRPAKGNRRGQRGEMLRGENTGSIACKRIDDKGVRTLFCSYTFGFTLTISTYVPCISNKLKYFGLHQISDVTISKTGFPIQPSNIFQ